MSARQLLRSLASRVFPPQLPAEAKRQVERDKLGLPEHDPGPETAVRAHVAWLTRAQDRSASRDGGVARDFSLIKGWATSYPETTGYIVPTLLECARRDCDEDLRERGRRMLDWLVSIQLSDGGIQGGRIDSEPRVPVTFNTGQVLLGLAAGVAEFGEGYREPMNRAAAWLRDSLDPDGCWRRHPTPFAAPGEKAYETHVSWGLFEAERLEPGRGYGEAGLKQCRWAMTKLRPNGWVADCCLIRPEAPLTHTLGYMLRGLLEGYLLTDHDDLLASARRLADALLAVQEPSGRLAGRWTAQWRPARPWACLTGISQIAACWSVLHRLSGEARYLDGMRRANRYVRRTVCWDGSADIVGAVAGSFPIDGGYGAYEYLNWSAKFAIDANLMELDSLAQQDPILSVARA